MATTPGPDVIVDFIFDTGLLFIAIANIGARPAFKVSVSFSPKLIGMEGTKDMSAMPLFRNIEFLAPHKQIRTLFDTSAAYFRRAASTKIAVQIAFQDARRRRHRSTIHHDLQIYKDIGYIEDVGKTGEARLPKSPSAD